MTRSALTVSSADKDAAEIGDLCRKARGSLIDSVRFAIACGQRLTAKKASLPHGAWLPWLKANAEVLGFDSRRTASRLIALAENGASTSHLDEVGALTISRQLWGNNEDDEHNRDVDLDSLLRDEVGELTPRARQFIREVRAEKVEKMRAVRDAREAALGNRQFALPDKRYGVIYADPPWLFETWSDAGKADTSADNHYPTCALGEIMCLNVPSISADDCALFLWATAPMLPHALEVMDAWGFKYVTHVMWAKDRTGTGYWFLNKHELLLLGARGDVPPPAMGTRWSSVVEARRGRHSEKPEAFYELIETYFPNLPKIELYARVARPGWEVWGLEAPEKENATSTRRAPEAVAIREGRDHDPIPPEMRNPTTGVDGRADRICLKALGRTKTNHLKGARDG